MHARRLVELAGWICVHHRSLLRPEDSADDALAEYWIASRCRLDEWGRALRRLGDQAGADSRDAELRAVVEEIVVSDILTRTVAAITYSFDEGHPNDDRSAIGRNALDAHAESLSRARALTFESWPGDSEEARWLRTLSAKAERWSDALVSYFDAPGLARRLAHDGDRWSGFADDRRTHGANPKAAGALLGLSIRSSFASPTPPFCEELNRRVGGAALGLFGPASFNGFGLPRSPWMIRVERTSDEAVGLLDSLFGGDFQRSPLPTPLRWRL